MSLLLLLQGTTISDYVVECQTEVITLTTQGATIYSGHVVVCQTEVIVLTSNRGWAGTPWRFDADHFKLDNEYHRFDGWHTDTNEARTVNCATEVISFTENNAQINGEHHVNCATEVITLVAATALVTWNLDVVWRFDADHFTLDDSNHTFDGYHLDLTGDRSVSCYTEVIVLTANKANAIIPFFLTCQTEQVSVTANPAIIGMGERIDGYTAQIVITTNPATVSSFSGDIPSQNPDWQEITSDEDTWSDLAIAQNNAWREIPDERTTQWGEGSVP